MTRRTFKLSYFAGFPKIFSIDLFCRMSSKAVKVASRYIAAGGLVPMSTVILRKARFLAVIAV